MTTRRNFLKGGTAAATEIVSAAAACLSARMRKARHAPCPSPSTAGRSRPSTCTHCHFREAGALLGADAAVQLPRQGAAEAFIEIDKG